MKKVFLILGIAGFHAAGAQQNEIFNVEEYLQKKKNLLPALPAPVISPFTIPEQFNATGAGIVSLPTDNMPCIKVDMNQFTQMPNPALSSVALLPLLAGDIKPGDIPNAALPGKKYKFSR